MLCDHVAAYTMHKHKHGSYNIVIMFVYTLTIPSPEFYTRNECLPIELQLAATAAAAATATLEVYKERCSRICALGHVVDEGLARIRGKSRSRFWLIFWGGRAMVVGVTGYDIKTFEHTPALQEKKL